MKIYHNQLANTLQQKQHPVWLVFGDEPWQKNNAIAQIKQHYGQQGFSDVQRFAIDDKFDWELLLGEFQALSLFANLRIFELDFIQTKLNERGQKALLSLAEQLNDDTIVICFGDKLDANVAKKKWFKSLESKGCYIPVYNIEGKHLHQWAAQHCRTLGLNLDSAASQLIIDFCEGNLLALSQELEKLAILFDATPVLVSDIEALLINQSKFNPFQLIDEILSGNLKKCLTIIQQLQQDGSAIGQLIWFIHKELNILLAIKTAVAHGTPLNEAFSQNRIWDKKKPAYNYALNHISDKNLGLAQARLAEVDLLSKSSGEFDPFIPLFDVIVTLFHGEQTNALKLDYDRQR